LSAEQFAENVNSQNQFKTTHIVIHDQTLSVDSGLKTPSTPLPPPTPATPLSREKGRYTIIRIEIMCAVLFCIT
jgi:hypothetical protein